MLFRSGYAEKGDSEGVPRDVILLQLIDNKVEREIVQEKTGDDRSEERRVGKECTSSYRRSSDLSSLPLLEPVFSWIISRSTLLSISCNKMTSRGTPSESPFSA